jgi:hypothetical protein
MTSDNGNGLYISVAPLSSGPTFTVGATYPVATNPSAAPTIQEDKPWLTVDNSTNLSTEGSASWFTSRLMPSVVRTYSTVVFTW